MSTKPRVQPEWAPSTTTGGRPCFTPANERRREVSECAMLALAEQQDRKEGRKNASATCIVRFCVSVPPLSCVLARDKTRAVIQRLIRLFSLHLRLMIPSLTRIDLALNGSKGDLKRSVTFFRKEKGSFRWWMIWRQCEACLKLRQKLPRRDAYHRGRLPTHMGKSLTDARQNSVSDEGKRQHICIVFDHVRVHSKFEPSSIANCQ